MGILDILFGGSSQQPKPSLLQSLMGQSSSQPTDTITKAGAKVLGFPDAPAPSTGTPLLEELGLSGKGQSQQSQIQPQQASMGLSSQPQQAQIQMPPQPPQQAAMGQPQQSHGGGNFLSSLKNTLTSKDFGDRLTEGLIGFSGGDTLADSFSRGGTAMYQGNMGRRERNQTVDWLTNQGFSQTEAQAAASDPKIMQQILNGQQKGISPLDALKLAQGEIGLKKSQIELDRMMNPQACYRMLTAEEKKEYGLPENGVYQAGADGKILAINGAGGANTNDKTNDIKNYEYAKSSGYEGSFPDYMSQKSRTNIKGNNIELENLPTVTFNTDGKVNKEEQAAFLEAIPKDLREIVKGVSEGRMSIDKITSLRGGERQELAKIISQYDPTFDTSQPRAKEAIRRDYSTGEMAKMAASTNLAIQHMAGMFKEFKKLDNTNIPVWNTVANVVKRNVGDSAQAGFETYKLGVSEELAKAFHNTGAVPESAVNQWKESISSSSTPEQLKAAVNSALHMLAARTETYSQRYLNVMGEDAPEFLTPSSVKALNDMGIDPTVLDPRYVKKPESGEQTSGGPQIGQVIDGYEYLGGDPKQEKSWRQIQ